MKKSKRVNKSKIVFPRCDLPTTIYGFAVFDDNGVLLHEQDLKNTIRIESFKPVLNKGRIKIKNK